MNTHTPRLITLFSTAQRQAQLAVYLGYLAIACFGLFGTLASMERFNDNTLIYVCFHYLPYALIGLSIPFSLYHAFLMYRYRIMQFMILVIMLGFGIALPIASAIFYVKDNSGMGSMALFVAMIGWLAMPYLFRVNIKRFLEFLKTEKTEWFSIKNSYKNLKYPW